MDNTGLMHELERAIVECTRCPLHLSRNNAVPGEGRVPARLIFIGEAPGKKEDELGRPFVGKAGSILDGLLESFGIERSDVFITSVIKCRPPGNRDPVNEEISSCMPYLVRQIDLIDPQVIITMGRFATASVFGYFGLDFETLGKARRKAVLEDERIIFPVYHPAVVTHNPGKMQELKEDFMSLKKLLDSV